MRRKILKGQNVVVGQDDDRLRISRSRKFAKSLQYRNQVFGGPIIGDDENNRPSCRLLQQD